MNYLLFFDNKNLKSQTNNEEQTIDILNSGDKVLKVHLFNFKISYVFLIIFFLFIIYCIFFVDPIDYPFQRGTYDNGDILQQRLFSFDAEEENVFYYTEDYCHIYIKGVVKKKDDGEYFISCNKEKNKSIIPDQSFEIQKDIIILTIRGEKLAFKKSSNYIETIGRESIYE